MSALEEAIVDLTRPAEVRLPSGPVSPDPHPTVVGIPEIADRLGVERATVDQWKWRGLLPDPTWTVGGRPAWSWREVERWARRTGRLAK